MATRTTSEGRRFAAADEDKRGGYAAGAKPATQLRPPPASIVKPADPPRAAPAR